MITTAVEDRIKRDTFLGNLISQTCGSVTSEQLNLMGWTMFSNPIQSFTEYFFNIPRPEIGEHGLDFMATWAMRLQRAIYFKQLVEGVLNSFPNQAGEIGDAIVELGFGSDKPIKNLVEYCFRLKIDPYGWIDPKLDKDTEYPVMKRAIKVTHPLVEWLEPKRTVGGLYVYERELPD